MMTRLDLALGYASCGWRVFPSYSIRNGMCECGKPDCQHPGKHPKTSNGFHAATTDRERIGKWWSCGPLSNISLATGRVSNLYVLDIDHRHGGLASLQALEEKYGPLPETDEVITGGDGRHKYFRGSEDGAVVPSIADGKFDGYPGIELKGENGCITAPGSLHASGRTYEWLVGHSPNDIEIALLPDWIVKIARNQRRAAPELSSGKIPTGQRNHQLVSVAGTLRNRGMQQKEILTVLRAVNTEQCDPPLPDSEVAAIAHSIAKYPARESTEFHLSRDGSRPEIVASNRQLRDVSSEAMGALLAYNVPPVLFVRGGSLVRVSLDEHSQPRVEKVDRIVLRGMLSRAADWALGKKSSFVSANPPLAVADDILALGAWPGIPPLSGIVTAPVVTPRGDFVTGPGYDEGSGLFYVGDTFDLSDLNTTHEAVRAAVGLLLEDLLGDFPFSDEASRSHALALLVLPFVRRLISGSTPLHLLDAPTPGSGKGLLADVCCIPFNPLGLAVTTSPSKENSDEWRKRISSVLLAARSHMLIDNISGRLASADLSAAITSNIWEDRTLGSLGLVTLPQRLIWVGTANNCTLSREMARRTVWIRLDPRLERPWERGGFRHENLRQWARDNRVPLVRAALTLVKAWLEKGQSRFTGQLPGSFESWASVVGGILQVGGVQGFLDNSTDFLDRVDPERHVWAAFVERWWAEFEGREVGASDLFPLAEKILSDVLLGDSERSRQIRFGKLLSGQVDRVYGCWQIRWARVKKRAAQYRLEERQTVVNVSGCSDTKSECGECFTLPMYVREEREKQ